MAPNSILATVSAASDTVFTVARGHNGAWAASYAVAAWSTDPAEPGIVYGPIGGTRLFPSQLAAFDYAVTLASREV